MASLKGNIILNLINTLTSLLVPIVTFPYAARILLPEGIGIINFQQSIINYIVLFTSIGIPLYGVREIARCRDDIRQRNLAAIEIIILNITLSLAGYIAVFVLGKYVPRISQNLSVFYILSASIIFTALGVEWFYKAIEDFKFITIRAVIFRLLAAIGLFVFVKTKDDILAYSFVIVASSVGNNVANFLHLRKYIFFNIDFDDLNIKKHVRPALTIFMLNVIISLYTQLNIIMLGFMGNNEMVGYYSAGNKLSHIVLTAIASISTVMLPRFSNLYCAGNIEEIKRLSQKSYNFIVAFALPMVFALIILAKPITHIFCGDAYDSAINVLIFTSPIICLIAISNLIGIQILYPQGKENLVIYSTMGGAIVNVIFNLILIPFYQENGAAISTCVAELIVLTIQIFVGRKLIQISFISKQIVGYLIASVAMTVLIILLSMAIENELLLLLMSILLGGGIYGVFLFAIKDEVALSLLSLLGINK